MQIADTILWFSFKTACNLSQRSYMGWRLHHRNLMLDLFSSVYSEFTSRVISLCAWVMGTICNWSSFKFYCSVLCTVHVYSVCSGQSEVPRPKRRSNREKERKRRTLPKRKWTRQHHQAALMATALQRVQHLRKVRSVFPSAIQKMDVCKGALKVVKIFQGHLRLDNGMLSVYSA